MWPKPATSETIAEAKLGKALQTAVEGYVQKMDPDDVHAWMRFIAKAE